MDVQEWLPRASKEDECKPTQAHKSSITMATPKNCNNADNDGVKESSLVVGRIGESPSVTGGGVRTRSQPIADETTPVQSNENQEGRGKTSAASVQEVESSFASSYPTASPGVPKASAIVNLPSTATTGPLASTFPAAATTTTTTTTTSGKNDDVLAYKKRIFSTTHPNPDNTAWEGRIHDVSYPHTPGVTPIPTSALQSLPGGRPAVTLVPASASLPPSALKSLPSNGRNTAATARLPPVLSTASTFAGSTTTTPIISTMSTMLGTGAEPGTVSTATMQRPLQATLAPSEGGGTALSSSSSSTPAPTRFRVPTAKPGVVEVTRHPSINGTGTTNGRGARVTRVERDTLGDAMHAKEALTLNQAIHEMEEEEERLQSSKSSNMNAEVEPFSNISESAAFQDKDSQLQHVWDEEQAPIVPPPEAPPAPPTSMEWDVPMSQAELALGHRDLHDLHHNRHHQHGTHLSGDPSEHQQGTDRDHGAFSKTYSQQTKKRGWNLLILGTGLVIALLVLGVGLGIGLGRSGGGDDGSNMSGSESDVLIEGGPTAAPTMHSSTLEEIQIREKLEALVPSELIASSSDAFRLAVQWYARDDIFRNENMSSDDAEFIQRFVLIWLWFHSTNGGTKPWKSCNPPRSNESAECEFQEGILAGSGAMLETSTAIRYMSPLHSECEWVHVECADMEVPATVTGLQFVGNGMTGTFPIFLILLEESLTSLVLGGSDFVPEILPSEIGNLEQLTRLELVDIPWESTIPTELYNLTKLEILTLAKMQLRGSIASDIGSLSNLRALKIAMNFRMQGPMPSEMGRLLALTSLRLNNINLQFSIPQEIGNLENLMILRLEGNALAGQIPDSFMNLTQVEEFVVSDNMLQGTIPDLEMAQAYAIRMSGNRLTGPIPESLYINENQMEVFDLKNNLLSGSINESIGNFANLQFLLLSQNQLTGTVPRSLGTFTKLLELDISRNLFVPPFPAEVCSRVSSGMLRSFASSCAFQDQEFTCSCCTPCL